MRQSWNGILDVSDDHSGSAGSAPGKRQLTDRIQLKADPTRLGGPVQLKPADGAARGGEHNGLSCEQSFLDSVLHGPVQRRADGGANDAQVHELAAHGTAGSGGALPYLAQIQGSFGGHDVSNVQAHTDGNAAEAARGMGASAFATGNHVAFAGAPDLHTAAHEAAHVVQQRAGVHLSGGVGAEGDAYERHADQVADAVVRGESAEALLGPSGGAAGGASVQRKDNADYQKFMDTETRSVDTAGNKAAEAATVENFGAGEEKVIEENANGQKIARMESKFGMLPQIHMPLDHTQKEHDKLRKATDEANASVGGHGAAPKERLLKNYAADLNELPRASLHYNTLVPLANLAAKSYAKSDEVGQMTGLGVDMAISLDQKETAALAKASHRTISEDASVKLAGDNLNNTRHAMIGASHDMAVVVRDVIIASLQAEAQEHQDKKKAIAEKIEKITKIVGYVEQAGAAVAGAGGFANAHLPGGAVEPELPNTKATWGDDMEKVGGGIEKAGGIASKVVSFGLNLYYEEQVAALDRHIATINGVIAVHEAASKQDKLAAAHSKFKAATGAYKTAVDKYLAAITDRRQLTAQIGQAADHIVDKKGKNNDVSDAVLWMTTVKETQAHLDVGINAGTDAQTAVDKAVAAVGPHRDPYSKDPAVREHHQGGKGPDWAALDQMYRLTRHWLTGAARVKAIIDEHAAAELDPMRENAGWSGRY